MSGDPTALPGARDDATATRWELLRDLTAFQLKLALDALRDLVLSPLSLVAGVWDLVAGGERPGRFYQVLRAGHASEAWIDLFGAARRDEPGDATPRAGADAVVARVEKLVVEQYERGGITASAKAAIDRSLDALARRRSV